MKAQGRSCGVLALMLSLGLLAPASRGTVIINELDSDTVGTDALEFVELYDGGVGSTSLTGLVVVFWNGNGDISYGAFDLDGFSTDSLGYFVLGNAAVSSVDIVFAGNFLQNGQDAVGLYTGDATSFPNGTAVTTTGLIDAIVYDTADADDAGLLVLLNAGQPQIDEGAGGAGGPAETNSIARCPNGSGGARNTSTYIQGSPTPGAASACECLANADCDDGSVCTGTETCNTTTHVCLAGTPLNCNDSQFCNGLETCDPVNGCQNGTSPDCADAVDCTVDTCNESTDICDHTPDNGACGDGLFCNGADICDPLNGCQSGAPPDCDDSVDCTTDSCNEDTDVCDHAPDDAVCDDGQFCNGAETCDSVDGCQPGTDPCFGGSCDEDTDTCGGCVDDSDCDDGLYCNGAEACVDNACEAGTAPDCDDGVGCTTDSCNEDTDTCDHTPDDGACDDGLFCNGSETCDAISDCQAGTAPDCDDGVDCTVDTCNEGTDSCDNSPDDSACDDDVFCNGAETCDPVNGCQQGTAPDCNDGVDCTVDSCNEDTNSCDNTPDDASCDDGQYCNGLETCDPVNDCQAGSAPCVPGEICDEVSDICSPLDFLIINEVDADQTGTDAGEFVELFDGGVGNTPLDGLVVVFWNGSNDLSYGSFDLDGFDTDAAGYFVLGNAAVPGVDKVFAGNFLQNGQDAVSLHVGDASSFPNNTPVTTAGVLDAIVYDTSDPDDPGLLVLLNAGQPQVDENGLATGTLVSMQRCPNGSGGARNTDTYILDLPTPDATNSTLCIECLVDADCDDGDACNGMETCEGITCQPGTPLTCDDGQFCNGAETCDALDGCQAGTPPDCDDGVDCTVDTCNESTDFCDHTPDDSACDDGQFCNGSEPCDALDGCQAGTPPDCDDGVDCTVDTCNEDTDSCDHAPDDGACDDGQYCNGLETCDALDGCQAGTPPDCDDGVDCTVDACNEDTDSCDHTPDDGSCDDGQFCNGMETCDPLNGCQAGTPPDCDDGVDCTVDTCNEDTDSCDHTPDDGSCDDGQFCNGSETCDALDGCQAGTPPDCDDGVDCTVDACNEDTDSCDHTPDDGACDDGQYCNGSETCDALDGCQAGTPPECDDGVDCTADSCNEDTDSCDHTPDDGACDDGLYCNGSETCDALNGCQAGTPPDCDDGVDCTADSCNEDTDSCDHVPDDGACDDGQYCNGSETCDALDGCQAGTPPDCDDGVDCTTDSCNEDTDSCDHAPDDGACDDGQYCNGSETCDAIDGCLPGTDPCPDQSCDEDTDSCGGTCAAWCCDGDANGDCVVNPLDSGFILARLGEDPCVEGCAADVNCDGEINPLDDGYAKARFSTCDPPPVCEVSCP